MEVQERIKQRRLDMGLSVDRMISELKKLGVTMSRATYYRYESKDIDKIPISSLPPIATIFADYSRISHGVDADENNPRIPLTFYHRTTTQWCLILYQQVRSAKLSPSRTCHKSVCRTPCSDATLAIKVLC